MRRPPFSWLAWFSCGLGCAVAICLVAADVRGAAGLLALVGLITVLLAQRRPFEYLPAFLGVLTAVDAFVVSLWISPSCDLSERSSAMVDRAPNGALRLACEPRDEGGLLLWAVAGTVTISLLLITLSKMDRAVGQTAPTPRTESLSLRKVALCCAAAALATSGLAAGSVLSENDWSPTALVRMARNDPIAQYAQTYDPSFKLFAHEAHYDGVYFYAIGADPIGLGEAHELLDLAVHRYTHPLYGWLAWLLSIGMVKAVPFTLLLINLLAMGFAGGAFAHLAARLGISPWLGLSVALNPGLLASVSFDTAEPLGAALLAVALLLWLRGRLLLGGVAFLFVCLTRQPFAVIPIALGVWELVTRVRSTPRADLVRRLGLLALGPIAMALWQLYLFFRFDELPFATGEIVLTLPFEGWASAFKLAAFVGGEVQAQVGLASLPILVAALGIALIGTVRSLSVPGPIGAIFLGLMAIYFSFEQLAVVYPKDLLRFSSIPWMLLPLVLLIPRAKEVAATDE